MNAGTFIAAFFSSEMINPLVPPLSSWGVFQFPPHSVELEHFSFILLVTGETHRPEQQPDICFSFSSSWQLRGSSIHSKLKQKKHWTLIMLLSLLLQGQGMEHRDTHREKLYAGLAWCCVEGRRPPVDCRAAVEINTAHCEHPGVTCQQTHRCHQPEAHGRLLTLLVFALQISSSRLLQLWAQAGWHATKPPHPWKKERERKRDPSFTRLTWLKMSTLIRSCIFCCFCNLFDLNLLYLKKWKPSDYVFSEKAMTLKNKILTYRIKKNTKA